MAHTMSDELPGNTRFGYLAFPCVNLKRIALVDLLEENNYTQINGTRKTCVVFKGLYCCIPAIDQV